MRHTWSSRMSPCLLIANVIPLSTTSPFFISCSLCACIIPTTWLNYVSSEYKATSVTDLCDWNLLGKLLQNFLINFLSFYVLPSTSASWAMELRWLLKSSIESPSFIVKFSNSDDSMSILVRLELLMPSKDTCRISHASLAETHLYTLEKGFIRRDPKFDDNTLELSFTSFFSSIVQEFLGFGMFAPASFIHVGCVQPSSTHLYQCFQSSVSSKPSNTRSTRYQVLESS